MSSSSAPNLLAPVSASPSPSSALCFTATAANDVTQELLEKAATLFSANYGVWGDGMGRLTGKRVTMTAAKLRAELLQAPESTVLVTCTDKHGALIGHAFATVWSFDGGSVGWITQLVVDAAHRRRYIATQLIQMLKRRLLFRDITAIGLVSSHPASVCALAKYSGVSLNAVDTDFIARHAQKIFATTPITYLQPKPNTPFLRGSLFEGNGCETGAVSCVLTNFYVDHREPRAALEVFKEHGRWCLGELPAGHEYLIIVPVEQGASEVL